MNDPKELSIAEIREFIIHHNFKVTNHVLVKHFKCFLTHPQMQNESRKQFKTYVNILCTIKNENNQKYLILRKKYHNECPSNDIVEYAVASTLIDSSTSGEGIASNDLDNSTISLASQSATPKINNAPISILNSSTLSTAVSNNVEVNKEKKFDLIHHEDAKADNTAIEIHLPNVVNKSENESTSLFCFSSDASRKSDSPAESVSSSDCVNQISVKEATRKFNRMASEEEAKIISPPSKKRPEKLLEDEHKLSEVTLSHPKAKEWIVSMAKASFQDLAKLATMYPELVKLQDPSTGYTALHWAAKHGNADVVKLIAGSHQADVNARTNAGYTPLHLATQFGRDNIFELLWNVYKANRDLMDWSGNKPLDYSKQRTNMAASTCSSEYRNHFLSYEVNNFPVGSQLSRNLWASGGGSNSGGGSLGSVLTRGNKRSNLLSETVSERSNFKSLSRSQTFLTGKSRRQSNQYTQSKMFMTGIVDDLIPCTISSPPDANLYYKKSGHTKSEHGKLIQETSKKHVLTENESLTRDLEHKFDRKSKKEGLGASELIANSNRKESFLRKTLRAAASANRHNNDIVTNQTFGE